MSTYFGLIEAAFVLALALGFGVHQLLGLRALERKRQAAAGNEARGGPPEEPPHD